MESLIMEILDDLIDELGLKDASDIAILTSKVKNAYREVREKRNYPEHFAEAQIGKDLEKHYSIIRNLALNDYNMIGAEFHKSISENGISRTFVDRDSILQSVVAYVLAF